MKILEPHRKCMEDGVSFDLVQMQRDIILIEF